MGGSIELCSSANQCLRLHRTSLSCDYFLERKFNPDLILFQFMDVGIYLRLSTLKVADEIWNWNDELEENVFQKKGLQL
jgi:hypothetical protein